MQMDIKGQFASQGEPPSGSIADFDHGKYLPYLEGIDLSDAQKREFLAIIWDIMRTWVVMDLPIDSCGQIMDALLDPSVTDSGDIK